MNENQLQSECFCWFWNTYPDQRRTFFSVPNERTSGMVRTMQLKAMGLLSGAPDLIWMAPEGVVCFEFKSPKGKLRQSQRDFLKAVQGREYLKYHVIKDMETFMNIVIDMLHD